MPGLRGYHAYDTRLTGLPGYCSNRVVKRGSRQRLRGDGRDTLFRIVPESWSRSGRLSQRRGRAERRRLEQTKEDRGRGRRKISQPTGTLSSQGIAHTPLLRLTGNQEPRGVDYFGTGDDWGGAGETPKAVDAGRNRKPEAGRRRSKGRD